MCSCDRNHVLDSGSLVAAPCLLGARSSENSENTPQAVLASRTLQQHLGFWLTEGRPPKTAPKSSEFTTVSYNTGSEGRHVSQLLLQRRAGRRFRERRPAPKPALVKETTKTHRVRSFFDFEFDPSKRLHFCNREFKKHEKTRGFGFANAAKPRPQRLQTVFFKYCSRFAAPGLRIPSAVWLLGAQAFANKIPSLSLGRPILRKHCHTRCLQVNL